jgi:hypothetical protein
VPSASGTGEMVSPSVLPGKRPESSPMLSPGIGANAATNTSAVTASLSAGGGGDDRAAVGVADQDDGALERVEDGLHGRRRRRTGCAAGWRPRRW